MIIMNVFSNKCMDRVCRSTLSRQSSRTKPKFLMPWPIGHFPDIMLMGYAEERGTSCVNESTVRCNVCVDIAIYYNASNELIYREKISLTIVYSTNNKIR